MYAGYRLQCNIIGVFLFVCLFFFFLSWVPTAGKFLIILDLNFVDRHVADYYVRQTFVDRFRYGNEMACHLLGSLQYLGRL